MFYLDSASYLVSCTLLCTALTVSFCASSGYTLNESTYGSEPLCSRLSLTRANPETKAVFVPPPLVNMSGTRAFHSLIISILQCCLYNRIKGPVLNKGANNILHLGKFSRMLWYRIED